MAFNFQNGKNRIKLLTEYEGVIKIGLGGNAIFAAFMSGRK
jgi:hypothetical protein